MNIKNLNRVNNMSMVFANKDIKVESAGSWKILIVDDEKSAHSITAIVLKNFIFDNKKIEIIDAYNVIEAKKILKEHCDIALILLDVVMETDDAGLKLIEYIRQTLKNKDVRIVIRTGQAGFAPEKEVIREYDINDYKEKTDLTDTKLYTTIYVALRSYRDIKNAKELQLSLQKSEAKLTKAQRIAHIGNWEWNLVTNKIFLSDEIYKIIGISSNRINLNPDFFFGLIHPEDIKYVRAKVYDAIKSKESYFLQYRIIMPDGDIRYIYANAEIILDKQGHSVKLFGVLQDVTKQKKAELLLKENEKMQNEIFKQKIKEQEQKAISDAKDSFLLLFTHELKTPLNAIINFTKYLLRRVQLGTIQDVPVEKKVKLLEQIELSALRMLEDITNILDLSRLKSNKIMYNILYFDPLESIKSVIQEHSSLAKEHNTNITLTTNEAKKYIKSDEYRFKQILSNIISNAIKYTSDIVNIVVNSDLKEYTIVIEDNGKGVEDDKKAFELFEQIDDYVVSKSQTGTGIGLNFVKLLCDDLNIKYKLEKSEELGGVKFTLIVSLND